MTKLSNIPKVSKKEFLKRLKTRKYEDLDLIKITEDYLIKKRGYVFKMPKPNTPIILLVSGGLDSIICWEILLKKYKLKVYPLFLTSKKQEKQSIEYFSSYYQNKYPSFSQSIFNFSVNILPKEIKTITQNIQNLDPNIIFQFLSEQNKKIVFSKSILSKSIMPITYWFYGLLYTQYLKANKNINIKTIFSGITPKDGIEVTSQTLTSIRLANLTISSMINDYSLQLSSPIFELHTKTWIEKHHLIQIANQLHLPIQKTWSCDKKGLLHCAQCHSCLNRKHQFKKAKIKDKTLYKLNNKNLFEAIYSSIHLNLSIKKLINKTPLAKYFKSNL